MRAVARAGAVALAVMSGPVVAQQGVQLDPEAVRACAQTARAVDRGAPACAGEAARACQARPGGGTTLGTTECLMAETAVWGDLMQAALADQAQRLGQQDPALVPQLNAAQKAWIAYRDAECGLRYGIWIEGSIRTIIAADCHLIKTAQRAIEVRFLGSME